MEFSWQVFISLCSRKHSAHREGTTVMKTSSSTMGNHCVRNSSVELHPIWLPFHPTWPKAKNSTQALILINVCVHMTNGSGQQHVVIFCKHGCMGQCWPWLPCFPIFSEKRSFSNRHIQLCQLIMVTNVVCNRC